MADINCPHYHNGICDIDFNNCNPTFGCAIERNKEAKKLK